GAREPGFAEAYARERRCVERDHSGVGHTRRLRRDDGRARLPESGEAHAKEIATRFTSSLGNTHLIHDQANESRILDTPGCWYVHQLVAAGVPDHRLDERKIPWH